MRDICQSGMIIHCKLALEEYQCCNSVCCRYSLLCSCKVPIAAAAGVLRHVVSDNHQHPDSLIFCPVHWVQQCYIYAKCHRLSFLCYRHLETDVSAETIKDSQSRYNLLLYFIRYTHRDCYNSMIVYCDGMNKILLFNFCSDAEKSKTSSVLERLTKDELAELAKSILTSQSSPLLRTARSTTENRTLETTTTMNGTGNETNEVAVVSRLVSFGYNLIRGCPEGEFESGIDSGIRTSNPIFKLTFNKERNDSYLDAPFSQPDQVEIESHSKSDIELALSDNIYGGGKSYRDAMTTGVSAAGESFVCIYNTYMH